MPVRSAARSRRQRLPRRSASRRRRGVGGRSATRAGRGAVVRAAHGRRAGAPAGRTGRCRCCTSPTCTSLRRQRAQAATGSRGLAALEPDLVINTGDNLAHLRRGAAACSRRFGGLLDVPGVFVLRLQRLLRADPHATRCATCCPTTASATSHTPPLPWRDLRDALRRRGLGRPDQPPRRSSRSRASPIAFAGVDDPHLGYDDLEAVAGPADPTADVRHRGHPRAVPAGARPVRRATATTRSSPGTPTAASCACRARARWSPTATSSRPAPRACTGIRPTAPGDPGRVAARLRRAGHLAVRPGPLLLPPRGDAADPHPG